MAFSIRVSTLALTAMMTATMTVGAAVSALAQDLPQIRDTRTGKMWTPDMVSVDDPRNGPLSPETDNAFNPREQHVKVEGIVVQHPHANLMGAVPITAGPSVPIAVIDTPSLQVIPGRHWLGILYLTNNSASTVDAVVSCRFSNHGQPVEETRIVIPPAGPGERLGMPVRGPRYDIFVDGLMCRLLTPA
jgi:hypothetical protein